MARRRKTRTHNLKADAAKKTNDGAPKSFVLHAGQVGSSVKALSRDLRQVMEPNTAARLRERKSNKIKDFIAMSGPLHVTHIMVLAQSEANKNAAEDDKEEATSNVNLRISRLPRGPCLSFKILRYALVRDILAATKRPRSPGKEFATEPIVGDVLFAATAHGLQLSAKTVVIQLVLNNFSAAGNPNDARQLTLMQTMFQNLFPPIKVHTMPLSAARRVVLLSYNATTRTIDFRHYLISVRPVGISRSVRKIIEGTSGRSSRGGRAGSVYSAATSDASAPVGNSYAAMRAKGMPDLRNAQDISDYVLRHGDMGFLSSASEAESDASGGEEDPVTGENSKQVALPASYMGRANKKIYADGSERRAVRLAELGPRMELGLTKIEDGVGDGKGDVLFHEFIHKTPKEAAEISRKAKEKEKLAKKRRAEQDANVKRKQEEKERLKAEKAKKRAEKQKEGGAAVESEEEEESEDEADEFEYEDMFAGDAVKEEAGDEDDAEEELFDEPSDEEDEEGNEEEDDSDLSPIPYNSSEGDDSSDEEVQAPSKKAKISSGKPMGKKVTAGKPKFSMKAGQRKVK